MDRGNVHSDELVPMIQRVLSSSSMNVSELSAIAVSIGPGSFTGLRIGLSTAKGLCYGTGKSLVAVPTFEAVARSVFEELHHISTITILVDAKRNEYYCGTFNRIDEVVRQTKAIHVGELPTNLSALHGEHSVIVTDRCDVIEGNYSAMRCVDIKPYYRGTTIAAIGLQMFRQQRFADLDSLEPLYLKDFVATTKPKHILP